MQRPLTPDLDAALPVHLTGSGHGWFGAYLRYPVFSARWARLRLRPWGLGWSLLTTLMLVQQQLSPALEGSRLMGGVSIVLAMALWFGLPLVLGPWLAAWVRHRRWRWRRELPALLLAFALTAGLTQAVDHGLRPPIKRALSAWIEGPGAPLTVVYIDFRLVQQTLDGPFTGDAAHDQAQAEAEAQRQDARAGQAAMAQAEALYKPFIQATWTGVYLLVLLWAGGIAGIAALVRERRELAGLRRLQELAAAQAARREAETRLAVLQAQIEPHFLFNTLAGVRSAISGDPPRSVTMIDRLVDYLRAAIPRLRSSGDAAEATLGAQFEIARAYLALMATRLPRLSFRLEADPALQSAHCPPLMLLTLVENAVKHGLEPKLGPGSVVVTAGRAPAAPAARVDPAAPVGTRAPPRPAGDASVRPGEQLLLTVTDDGVGLEAGLSSGSQGAGLGLANLRERLLALYGPQASLQLGGRAGGGVVATLSVPLEWLP